MCFGQPSLFALLMLMLKAESFLTLSLTPQSRVTEGQCFPCYCFSVVPKFTVGCQDQLFPPYVNDIPIQLNAGHHHLTAHPVKLSQTSGKGKTCNFSMHHYCAPQGAPGEDPADATKVIRVWNISLMRRAGPG